MGDSNSHCTNGAFYLGRLIAALELTPLPQTIRELSFYHQVSLRTDEADDERYSEPSEDCDESLITAMNIMPIFRLAGLRAFNVSEQGA